MAKDDFLSSDDEEHDKPVTRKRPTRNTKPIVYEAELTSDSDEEEIVFKKVKNKDQDKTFTEDVSLLFSSDDEYQPKKSPPPKKLRKTVVKKAPAAPRQRKPRAKAIKETEVPAAPIDLLTSDEEDIIPSTKSPGTKKRKLSTDTTDMGNICCNRPSPPKKAKTTRTASGSFKSYAVDSDLASGSQQPLLGARTSAPTKGKTTIKRTSKETRASGSRKTSFISDVSMDVSMEEIQPAWEDAELLAERSMIDEEIARNLIKLWEEGNTIPFIARYRKNVIGTMTPEELRTTKETFDEICTLKKKMCTVVKAVVQAKKLTNKLQTNICAVRTIEELEHIYAPFKGDTKKSLAERAKKAGLEEPALAVLNNTTVIRAAEYVKPGVKEAQTEEEVEKGIMYILASEMATDTDLLSFLRELRGRTQFRLQTKKARQTSKTKENVELKGKKDPKLEIQKFDIYLEFDQRVDWLKPHQVLAINRGEALKILSVKIVIPEWFQKQYMSFCSNKWVWNQSRNNPEREKLVNMAIDYAYVNKISPLIEREIRADLKQKAEKESCKVFSDNLKHLLLMPPMKGKSILGIDPGYANGCKLALISPTGSLLAQSVVYPHKTKGNGYRGEHVIKDMMVRHGCNLICIGNGTACRQTEEWISELIKTDFFIPLTDVQYTIVSEDGASIYSCGDEARKEFGPLDPNIISAVSLARRIQDPMAELVKVEPCHLGVGMYQLDLKKKQLEEALSEVVSECVSFVGVDINTASQCLLRRVAGLSDKKATQIIDHRERCGPFTHRKELLQVFGIGERCFEQCAGFLRVAPTDPNDTRFYNNKLTTPLDATIIHPESYPVVRKLLAKMNLKESDIGTDRFITNFKLRCREFNRDQLSATLKTDSQTIQLIFDALEKQLNHDLRTEVSKTPLFKKGVNSMEDLQIDQILTGRVKNVTSFGAFVDCGVERNGLVHVKFMKGLSLHLGDVIEVKVLKVDIEKGHISLEAVRKMS